MDVKNGILLTYYSYGCIRQTITPVIVPVVSMTHTTIILNIYCITCIHATDINSLRLLTTSFQSYHCRELWGCSSLEIDNFWGKNKEKKETAIKKPSKLLEKTFFFNQNGKNLHWILVVLIGKLFVIQSGKQYNCKLFFVPLWKTNYISEIFNKIFLHAALCSNFELYLLFIGECIMRGTGWIACVSTSIGNQFLIWTEGSGHGPCLTWRHYC